MILNSQDLQALCEVAIKAAKDAGAMIQQKARSNLLIKHKDAGSSLATKVVTDVDLLSQDLILKQLQPTLKDYDLGLLVEESDDDLSRFVKDYFWCVDPLDGTLSFIEQKPGYAVSIALVSKEGEAVVGVVFDPQAGTLYHAIKGSGAYRNERRWELVIDLHSDCQRIQDGGAVMNACWVLEKAPAYFVKDPKPQQGGGCLWDYAATACLFEEIGAFVSDRSGVALNLNCSETLYLNQVGVVFGSDKGVVERVVGGLQINV